MVIKGFGSRIGSLLIALAAGERLPGMGYVLCAIFIGAALSLMIFQEQPSVSFLTALLIMGQGTYLASTD